MHSACHIVIADKPLVFRDLISWIASLTLAMTPSVILNLFQDLINVAIHECILSIEFPPCFAYYRIIRVVAGVTSGSNLWAGALRATAPYRKSEFAMT